MTGEGPCGSDAAGGALGPPPLVRKDVWSGAVWLCGQSRGGGSSESEEDADFKEGILSVSDGGG